MPIEPRMINERHGESGQFKRATETGRALSQYRPANTAAQMTLVMGRNGRLRRDIRHGNGQLVTNYASRSSSR